MSGLSCLVNNKVESGYEAQQTFLDLTLHNFQ